MHEARRRLSQPADEAGPAHHPSLPKRFGAYLAESGVDVLARLESVARSAAMREVTATVRQAAASDATVVIYGESGTGKDMVARAIHATGGGTGAFVAVNCGAVPEPLLESEFFGYRKGAFTGANADKYGFLELATDGTLFLDEVGDIAPGLQIKLLRAIEGNGFIPLGATRAQHCKFRLIAATNRNLLDLARQEKIRWDFFYRIHILPIYLPPLRNRAEDLPGLIDQFMASQPGGGSHADLPADVRIQLAQYCWPGNIRELHNVLHRYLTLGRLEFTAKHPPAPAAPSAPAADFGRAAPRMSLRQAVTEFERKYLLDALGRCGWHRQKTAEFLGIDRRTLFAKMKAHRID